MGGRKEGGGKEKQGSWKNGGAAGAFSVNKGRPSSIRGGGEGKKALGPGFEKNDDSRRPESWWWEIGAQTEGKREGVGPGRRRGKGKR